MAGHSKWKNIQHRKGAQDKKRGKIFTKIAKEITVAAKLGGGDPAANARLRLVLLKARAANMPKDNIERAIKKGTGDTGADTFLEKTYEGYGPGGVAVLVSCLTDNVNRTVSSVRHAFTKSGGSLGTDGSVAYLFDRKGYFVFSKERLKEEDPEKKILDLAIEIGAEDFEEEEECFIIKCEVDDFAAVREGFEKELKTEPEVAEITYLAQAQLDLTDSEVKQKVLKLIDTLEDDDDVQAVYHNVEQLEEE